LNEDCASFIHDDSSILVLLLTPKMRRTDKRMYENKTTFLMTFNDGELANLEKSKLIFAEKYVKWNILNSIYNYKDF